LTLLHTKAQTTHKDVTYFKLSKIVKNYIKTAKINDQDQ